VTSVCRYGFIGPDGLHDWATRAAAAWGYGRECGREAAVKVRRAIDDQADVVFDK
jgi:hypothetical protein